MTTDPLPSLPEPCPYLPCPFCGSAAKVTPVFHGVEIGCSNDWCHAQPNVTGGDNADVMWNTRAQGGAVEPVAWAVVRDGDGEWLDLLTEQGVAEQYAEWGHYEHQPCTISPLYTHPTPLFDYTDKRLIADLKMLAAQLDQMNLRDVAGRKWADVLQRVAYTQHPTPPTTPAKVAGEMVERACAAYFGDGWKYEREPETVQRQMARIRDALTAAIAAKESK